MNPFPSFHHPRLPRPVLPSMPCSPHPHRRWVAASLLALTLLGSPAGKASAQPQTAAPQASAAANIPASAAITIAAPALTPARDLPLVRPPAGAPAASPYGLQAVWEQGDPIARATLLILLLMSVASWYVLVRKLIEQARLRQMAVAAMGTLSHGQPLGAAIERMQTASPFRFIAESAATALGQHAMVCGQVDLNTWLTQNIERSVATVQSRSQDGLAVLATVGATAPFVGLFGTVWGIYHALVKIGVSGQASIDRVAGPVGEALIMTALGLAVAVPAVLAYNWLVRRNRQAMEEVRNFGSELHTQALASASRGANAAPEA